MVLDIKNLEIDDLSGAKLMEKTRYRTMAAIRCRKDSATSR